MACSGSATSLTTRLRICSALVSLLCSSGSSKPSDNDSAIISDSSTVDTVTSSSSLGSTPNVRRVLLAHQL